MVRSILVVVLRGTLGLKLLSVICHVLDRVLSRNAANGVIDLDVHNQVGSLEKVGL